MLTVHKAKPFIGMVKTHRIFTYMQSWLQNNAWALIIAGVTMVSSYAIYGYKIDDLDKRVSANATAIAAQSDNNLQVQVSLAKIQTDIEYIKVQLDRINRN